MTGLPRADTIRPMSDECSNRAVPWITEEGSLDAAKFPIDGILQQAVESDQRKFESGVAILRLMHGSGRKEAGVFLMGLLAASDENWERRLTIVEALRDVQTEACARLLFTELRRVKSSNTTRQYLSGIIKSLAAMPAELVEEEFLALAMDSSFSHRMRSKFKEATGGNADFPARWS
ncbi:MAG TPA: hypothetical protein VG146_20595 [Verrucomicrobiae bacterium]|nr:hypothetical protein [Verrucomicrobiae bacterium]